MVMHMGALRISRRSDASGKVRATSKVPAAALTPRVPSDYSNEDARS